jgi:rubrerythrin
MNDRQLETFFQIMEQLKAVELAMARFYALCASSYPQDRALWEELAGNEEEHARRAEEFKQQVSARKEDYEPDKFNLAQLHTYRTGLEVETQRLRSGEIGRRSAVMIARDYEQTLVEKRFYKVVRSSRPDYLKISEDIERETRAHFQRLLDYIRDSFSPAG